MRIVGVSTSSKYPSAAVMNDGQLVSFRIDRSGRSHSATLMELIQSALCDANMRIEAIDVFAVDVGPGSFTGVRIGVSAINAMAFSLNRKVIPVSSLAAMRHLVPSSGTVCALIDARNGNG